MTSVNQNIDALFNRVNTLTTNGNISADGVKDELTSLFVQNGTVNGNKDGAKRIEQQILTLTERIADLENKAAEIQEKIDEKNTKLKKSTTALSTTATNLTGAQSKFREKCAGAAMMATRDAIASYRKNKGSSFEQCFNQAFMKRLGDLQGSQDEIQALYESFEAQKGGISSISKEIETAINSIDSLNAQLKTTQATITLLSATKTRMESTNQIANAYQNIDTNASAPIYSAEKAKIADEILSSIGAKPNAGGTQQAAQNEPVRDEKALQDAMANYAKLNEGTGYNSTWHATLDKNPQLQNLQARMNEGMIADLQNKGATATEILTFVSETWKVGIRQNNDGSWFIPDNDAAKASVFDPLAALANTEQPKVAEVSAENLKSLQDKGMAALDKMYQAGFTFKEAMSVMMQAFPDSGIEYDLNSQTSGRNYKISADSDASNGIYGQISEKIYQNWNVKAEQMKEPGEQLTIKRGHSDPIAFQNGNTTYTFITDRNDNGKFDFTDGDNNDLLGSKDGIAELTKFDYNGDGVIDANDKDKDGNLALDQLMLMQNNQQESVDSANDVDAYKQGNSYTNSVDFTIKYSTAKDLGITKIDLKNMNNYGNDGNVDMNGTQTVADFSVTMGGKEYQAKETLNTEENLNVFYGQIAQQNTGASEMKVKLSQSEVNSALNNAKGSDKINNIKEHLLEVQKDNKVLDKSIGSIDVDAETVNTLTGMAYLQGVRDTAEEAAERYINDEETAVDKSEEAVNEYFDKHNLDAVVKKAEEDK